MRSHTYQAELSLNKSLIKHLGKATLILNPRKVSSYHDADMRVLEVRVKSFRIMTRRDAISSLRPPHKKLEKIVDILSYLRQCFISPTRASTIKTSMTNIKRVLFLRLTF